MSKEAIKSQSELYEFVEYHKLQNRHSQINFKGLVSIVTAESCIENVEMEIWIIKQVFDKRGKLTLVGNNLDPYAFPEEFFPDYQKMEHVEKDYLQITGNHKFNEKIGEYSVKIFPLEKLQD